MEALLDLRLIRFFSFYLAVAFLLSTILRLRQYRSILSLVIRLRQRWPNLTSLVLSHRHIFLARGTLLPLVLVLVLLSANLLASRLIWPQADRFTVGDLLHLWPAVPLVLITGLAMFLFDVRTALRVGTIDEAMLSGYFDQAESWLKGWKAPVVRVLSLGFINPRQIVAKEVRQALEGASQLLNTTLWWVVLQTALRILFGISLWGSYALRHWLERLSA